jgi:hypothetical protein
MPGLHVRLYECQVTGVHENDRVLDAQSRSGRSFRQTSYLLPWISANGSGIDLIPKTGDHCLILATPQPTHNRLGKDLPGSFSVCIGFKVPMGLGGGQEQGGRLQNLPQGSMGFRVVAESGNEALLLLTRGGTAIIGAGGTCRTLYSPIDKSIIHLFDNWELSGPGGFVKWTREKGKGDVRYHAQYRTKVEGAEFTVDIAIDNGGGLQSPDPVSLTVHRDGGRPYLRVRVDVNGEAHIEGESINIFGRAGVNIDGAEVKIKNRQVLAQGDPI